MFQWFRELKQDEDHCSSFYLHRISQCENEFLPYDNMKKKEKKIVIQRSAQIDVTLKRFVSPMRTSKQIKCQKQFFLFICDAVF